MDPAASQRKTPYWLRLACLVSLLALSWAFAIYFISISNVLSSNKTEVATLLFGASSIALIVLSIIVAVLAFVGWQSIQGTIRDKVTAVTNEKVAALENELRGRAFSVQGYVIGEAARNSGTLEVYDREKMKEAIGLCRQGYEFLKKVGGAGEYMCLNNLVHFMFLLGDDANQGFLLKQARRLREAGEKHGSIELILTAAGVILKYSYLGREKAEIRAMLSSIIASDLSYTKKKEASMYLASFSDQ